MIATYGYDIDDYMYDYNDMYYNGGAGAGPGAGVGGGPSGARRIGRRSSRSKNGAGFDRDQLQLNGKVNLNELDSLEPLMDFLAEEGFDPASVISLESLEGLVDPETLEALASETSLNGLPAALIDLTGQVCASDLGIRPLCFSGPLRPFMRQSIHPSIHPSFASIYSSIHACIHVSLHTCIHAP